MSTFWLSPAMVYHSEYSFQPLIEARIIIIIFASEHRLGV
jgi:hypothetical protein